MRRLRRRRWDRKGSDINGSKWWDMVQDLNSVWSIGGVEGNSIKALRMGGIENVSNRISRINRYALH